MLTYFKFNLYKWTLSIKTNMKNYFISPCTLFKMYVSVQPYTHGYYYENKNVHLTEYSQRKCVLVSVMAGGKLSYVLTTESRRVKFLKDS